MIMGFDSDDATIFDRQVEFIQQSRISFSMSGMLSGDSQDAAPRSACRRGAARPDGPPEFGTNVIPLQMSREELLEGYFRVLHDLYEPEAYFARTDALFLDPSFDIGITKKRTWWRLSRRWLASEIRCTIEGLGLFARLMNRVADPKLRQKYKHQTCAFSRSIAGRGSSYFMCFIWLCITTSGSSPRTCRPAKPRSSTSTDTVNI